MQKNAIMFMIGYGDPSTSLRFAQDDKYNEAQLGMTKYNGASLRMTKYNDASLRMTKYN